jgi:uncharacterized protein YndB with AHSA1/START domain
MNAETPVIARVSHRFSAAAERVFDAWLDLELTRRFMFTIPTGELVRAEMDPRVGGTFIFVDRRDGQDVVHVGEYLELDRPRRIVFTFAVDGSEPSVVNIDIAPLESGCELTLTHEMDPVWADYIDRTERGWSTILNAMDAEINR